MVVIVNGTSTLTTGSFGTCWSTATFAHVWYKDALGESSDKRIDARRREIVFAVCCAESYLLEWVRDDVLKQKFDDLVTFFPKKKFDGIRDRWKNVITKLAKRNLIPKAQSFCGTEWNNFFKLVEYRNGLVHAAASYPNSNSQPKELLPTPTSQQLETISPRWAADVVRTLILDLHKSVGTKPPSWLVTP